MYSLAPYSIRRAWRYVWKSWLGRIQKTNSYLTREMYTAQDRSEYTRWGSRLLRTFEKALNAGVSSFVFPFFLFFKIFFFDLPFNDSLVRTPSMCLKRLKDDADLFHPNFWSTGSYAIFSFSKNLVLKKINVAQAAGYCCFVCGSFYLVQKVQIPFPPPLHFVNITWQSDQIAYAVQVGDMRSFIGHEAAFASRSEAYYCSLNHALSGAPANRGEMVIYWELNWIETSRGAISEVLKELFWDLEKWDPNNVRFFFFLSFSEKKGTHCTYGNPPWNRICILSHVFNVWFFFL